MLITLQIFLNLYLRQHKQHSISININSWKTFKSRLHELQAHVVLLQEHHLRQADISAASQWSMARHWKSLWTAAASTDKGGTSGGTAILVRRDLGLAEVATTACPCSHRILLARLEAAGHPPMIVGSIFAGLAWDFNTQIICCFFNGWGNS